jgi:hypothetical protein
LKDVGSLIHVFFHWPENFASSPSLENPFTVGRYGHDW